MKTHRLLYIILLTIACGFVAGGVSSCKSPKMKDADEAFGRGEYYDAAKIYRKVYNKYNKQSDRPLRGEIAYKMGRCYSLMNQSERATAAYQNALRYEWPDSTAILYLAQAQHMSGDWRHARENYERYLQLVPDDPTAKLGLRSCELAPQWREMGSRYTVKSAKFFNSQRADFCPMLVGDKHDQLYWTSSSPKATGDTLSGITGAKYCDVFVSKLDDKGKWSRPAKVEGELNSKWDEGCTSFSPDGSTMYLARAIRKMNAPTGVTICTSQRSEASWGAPQDFEITADTLSSYGDPAVSPDGKWLYFSSDMPGGQGGKDLWRIRIDDKVGTLENLGDQINTAGNERFPYVRSDSVLYFASDGHPGFGGLDLYKATLQHNGRWFIENMGSPMNSSGDDFGITFGQGESGYFSSNRKDARGFDHLFSFEKPFVTVNISGMVTDKDEEPVSGATIRIVGSDGSNKKAAANPDGTFQFELDQGVSYVMLATAPGYLNSRVQFQSDSTDESTSYDVDFVLAAMHKPQVIENIFYDFDKASLRPASKKALDGMVKVMKENPYVTIEMAAHTDRVGSDKYNNALSLRRAQSVINYLVAHGVDSARMKPAGYGKTRPKVVTKHIHRLYPQFAEGDTLTPAYIDTLSKANQAAADQINRRTEFQVLSTNFQPFAQDLKRMKEQEDSLHAAQKQAELEQEQADIEQAQQAKQEQLRKERAKAAAEAKKKAANERAQRAQERNDQRAAKMSKQEKKKAERKKKLAEQKAKRAEKQAKEKQKRAVKQAQEKLKRAEQRAKQKIKNAEKRAKQQEKRDRAKAKKAGVPYVKPAAAPTMKVSEMPEVVAARENLERVRNQGKQQVDSVKLKAEAKKKADEQAKQAADDAAEEAQRLADEEAARQAKIDEKKAEAEAKAKKKAEAEKIKELEKNKKKAEKAKKEAEKAKKSPSKSEPDNKKAASGSASAGTAAKSAAKAASTVKPAAKAPVTTAGSGDTKPSKAQKQKAKQEEQARKDSEKAKKEQERQAKKEAELKAKQEEQARKDAEKAKKEQERQAKKEAELKAKQEEQARKDAEKAKQETLKRQQQRQADSIAAAKKEAELKAKQEEQARKDAEKAKQEAAKAQQQRQADSIAAAKKAAALKAATPKDTTAAKASDKAKKTSDSKTAEDVFKTQLRQPTKSKTLTREEQEALLRQGASSNVSTTPSTENKKAEKNEKDTVTANPEDNGEDDADEQRVVRSVRKGKSK